MLHSDQPAIAIGRHEIRADGPCFIIAEVGINHGGDEALAAEMITAAAEAGADAVKLQTVTPEESYHPETESYRIFRDTVLSKDALIRLIGAANAQGLELFSTPGDFRALDLMIDTGMPAVKISSGLMTNLPLIERAARTGLPLIISTGMAHLSEVSEAVSAARECGAEEVVVLQCTSIYPADADNLNLRAMRTIADETGCPVGYSDHFDGRLACVAAAAAGAVALEKHFTLDRTRAGEDHAISLEPDSFRAMVADIRKVERMLGRPEKRPMEGELGQRGALHRRLVAARNIETGVIITEADLHLMRLKPDEPGIDARALKEVVGRKAVRPIQRLSGVRPIDIEGME